GYYLSSFADAVTAALPGSVRMKVERVVRWVGPDSEDGGEDDNDVKSALSRILRRDGEQSVHTLERRFPAARAALASLRRRGLVAVEDRLRPASGRTRHRRFYKMLRALAGDEAAEWARKRSRSYAVYAY